MFYGTTEVGPGDQGVGTVYKITPSGKFTTIYQLIIAMARTLTPHWYKAATATFTAQRTRADLTGTARYSKSQVREKSPRCITSITPTVLLLAAAHWYKAATATFTAQRRSAATSGTARCSR